MGYFFLLEDFFFAGLEEDFFDVDFFFEPDFFFLLDVAELFAFDALAFGEELFFFVVDFFLADFLPLLLRQWDFTFTPSLRLYPSTQEHWLAAEQEDCERPLHSAAEAGADATIRLDPSTNARAVPRERNQVETFRIAVVALFKTNSNKIEHV